MSPPFASILAPAPGGSPCIQPAQARILSDPPPVTDELSKPSWTSRKLIVGTRFDHGASFDNDDAIRDAHHLLAVRDDYYSNASIGLGN